MHELDELQAALDNLPDTPGGLDDTSEASAPRDDHMHRVASNETLETIAAQYGVTADAMLAANAGRLINDNLVVGQSI